MPLISPMTLPAVASYLIAAISRGRWVNVIPKLRPCPLQLTCAVPETALLTAVILPTGLISPEPVASTPCAVNPSQVNRAKVLPSVKNEAAPGTDVTKFPLA